ncbi:MAG: hypothetical protein WD768_15190 [Phycisphaeraceae bacterium]
MQNRPRILIFLLCLAVIAFPVVAEDYTPVRRPVPDELACKRALALIRETYKKDYGAIGNNARRKLATKLTDASATVSTDLPMQYTLLTEALAIASRSGDVATSSRIGDMMDRRFLINIARVRLAAASQLLISAESARDYQALTDLCLTGVDHALLIDDYDLANDLLNLAERAAVQTKQISYSTLARHKRLAMIESRRRFKLIEAQGKVLVDSPDDAAANVAVGKYLCFVKGDWNAGLPHLAKGSETALRQASQKELANPGDALSKNALANAWWDAARATIDTEQKLALQMHASGWYEKALPELNGSTLVIAEKNIRDAKAALVASGLTLPSPPQRHDYRIDLISLFDSERDALHGKWSVKDGELSTDSIHLWPRVQFPYHPSPEYDLKVTFSQPRQRHGITIFLPAGLRFSLGDADGSYGFSVENKTGENPTAGKQPRMIEPNRRYTIVIQVRRDQVIAMMGERKLAEFVRKDLFIKSWNFKLTDAEAIGVGTDDPVVFHEVEVIEVSGRGKVLR